MRNIPLLERGGIIKICLNDADWREYQNACAEAILKAGFDYYVSSYVSSDSWVRLLHIV